MCRSTPSAPAQAEAEAQLGKLLASLTWTRRAPGQRHGESAGCVSGLSTESRLRLRPGRARGFKVCRMAEFMPVITMSGSVQ